MKHSHSTLFLMELIIAILFFSLASTVCIQLFAKSHLLSKQTVNENYAVTHTQNLAESFLATDGDLAQMQGLFPDALKNENTLTLYFNNDWNPCDKDLAQFVATLEASSDGSLCEADITISPCNKTEEKALYSLHILHHIKERRGNIE